MTSTFRHSTVVTTLVYPVLILTLTGYVILAAPPITGQATQDRWILLILRKKNGCPTVAGQSRGPILKTTTGVPRPILELGQFDYENLGTLTQASGLEA